MIDIFKDLAELGLPVYQQGTAPEKLPQSFFTVWEDFSGDAVNASNAVRAIYHEWTLIYYTTDYSTVYGGLQAAINALKRKGYIVGGAGYDFNGNYDKWQARAVDIKKIEYLED